MTNSVIERERRLFADTLEAVGPDAPTNAGSWTAHDVAAHVASLDRLGGVVTFLGRTIVARGIRLNDLARRRPDVTERPLQKEKRRGFAATVASLRSTPPPPILCRPGVAAIGLFEVWAHHEDVRRPNGLPRDTHPDLTEVIEWLVRYSRVTDVPDGPQPDVAYWLAGRNGGPRPV